MSGECDECGNCVCICKEVIRVDEIEKVLNAVRDAWLRSPAQRLGQLLMNSCRGHYAWPDIWEVTDAEMINGLTPDQTEALRELQAEAEEMGVYGKQLPEAVEKAIDEAFNFSNLKKLPDRQKQFAAAILEQCRKEIRKAFLQAKEEMMK